MIRVDTNCAEDFLATQLKEQGLPVARERLDVGDVHISVENSLLVVERKTWSDLAASICDSRWHEQKSRMTADDQLKTQYAYLIEGAIPDWETSGCGVHAKALWAALLKTQIRDGMCVFHSANKTASVATVAYLFEQMRGNGFSPKANAAVSGLTTKRKRDNIDSAWNACVAMLCVVPGMSKGKAEDIAAVFPCMESLMKAEESDLSCITSNKRRLGPSLARRVVKLLHGENESLAQTD